MKKVTLTVIFTLAVGLTIWSFSFGLPDGSVSWSFDWTSPPTSTGRVCFYIPGSAASGNGVNKRDYNYSIPLFRDRRLMGLYAVSRKADTNPRDAERRRLLAYPEETDTQGGMIRPPPSSHWGDMQRVALANGDSGESPFFVSVAAARM